MITKEGVIQKVLEGSAKFEELTTDEKALFDDPSEINDIEKIIQTTAHWNTPLEEEVSSSWNSILNKTETIETNNRYVWLKVAAAVSLLVAVSYFILFSNETSVRTNVGDITHVELPDGSKVTLNALSVLTYNESGRKIELEGKARFDVVPGSTFEVITENFTTTVIGTSFDVSYEENLIEVSCYSGKVSVSDGKQLVELEEGERAYLENGNLVESSFDTDAFGKWINGEFYFDNVPFTRVVDEFERQFGIEVTSLPNEERMYKGYFYKDNLEEALDLIFKPMGYDYKLEGQRVIIK